MILPDSITALGDYAFQECTGLKGIKLSENLNRIGNYAFQNCTNLKKINLPEPLKSIGYNAFQNCSSLSELYFNAANCSSIGSGAFRGCIALESIQIGPDAVRLPTNGFRSCESLTQFHVAEENKLFVDAGGAVVSKDGEDFYICPNGIEGTYHIPDGVKHIGEYAFYECGKLTSIQLPDTVESIGQYAFYNCDGVTALSIPDSVEQLEQYAFYHCEELTQINIPDSVTSIGRYVFTSCPKLTVYCNLGSAIQKYAANNNIPFVTSTHSIQYTLEKQFAAPNGETMLQSVDNINNYQIKITNLTTGKQITGAKANLLVILLSAAEVSAGDTIRIELTSKQDETVPFATEVTLNEKMNGQTEMVTLQKGYIKTTPDRTDGSVFVYGADGQLKDTMRRSGSSFISKHLDAGNYKLVYIKGSSYLWQFEQIDGFTQAGLTQGKEYTVKDAKISDGVITQVENVTVPDIDEELLRYLDGSVSKYTVNTTEIMAGGLLNVRLEYQFKALREDGISNLSAVIDIPQGTAYVANSLSVDGVISNDVSEDTSGTRITVPLTQKKGVIRFSIRPYENRTLQSNARISFRANGRSFSEPVGTITVDVPYITITGSNTTNTKQVNVSGITAKNTTVAIYDNNQRIATAKSNASGRWSSKVTLADAFNGSIHNLVAKINGGTANEIASNVLSVCYSIKSISLKKLTLYHNGQTISFTLDSAATAKPILTFSPGSSFTFTAEIEGGEAISNLYFVSTRGTDKKHMEASYDRRTGLWTASGFFDAGNRSYVPGVISLEYRMNPEEKLVDLDYQTSDIDYESLPQTVKDAEVTIEENTFESEDSDGRLEASVVLDDPDKTPVDVTVERKPAEKNCTPSELIKKGYQELKTTDGKSAYIQTQYYSNGSPTNVNVEKADSLTISIITDAGTDIGKEVFVDLVSEVSKGMGGVMTGLFLVADVIEYGGQIIKLNDARSAIMNSPLSQSEKQLRLQKLEQLSQGYSAVSTGMMILSGVSLLASVVFPVPLLASCGVALISSLVGSLADYYLDATLQYLLDFNIRYAIDPSGYVFEGVPSNRLSGVKTTVYFQDDKGNPVLWDASEFDQLNPLITDSEGRYAWDVPEGVWQVKCELDGYETAYSDWLPVPPPQTGVNIGLISNVAPQIAWANLYESYAEIRFSKYMKVSTVTSHTIGLQAVNGGSIGITVTPTDFELSPDGEALARTFRVEPNSALVGESGYLISVAKSVESYAGVPMEENYEKTLMLKRVFTGFEIAENLTCEMGQTVRIPVQLTPAGDASDLVLTCTSDLPAIASIVSIEQFDESGLAYVTIRGSLPGTVQLTLKVVDSNLKQTVTFNVEQTSENPEPEYTLGDVNGDGKINSRDVAALQKHILESEPLIGDALAAADVNTDGKVNSRDVAVLQKHILEIEPLAA